MSVAEKWFNNVELGNLGLVTPAVSGIFDLAPQEVARSFTSGRSEPSDVTLRRSLVPVSFSCVVAGENHNDLVSKLAVLRGYLDPNLGWCEFSVENRPGLQTMARCLGFPVSIDQLPYQIRVVEFEIGFERYPYWEDDGYTSVDNPSSINNRGQLTTYPTYTCTVTSGGAGLTFTVGSSTFTYDGTLSTSDVLVVESDLPDVLLNDARDFNNTNQAAEYPSLLVGASAVSKGGAASFTLNVSYRQRYL